MKVIVEMLPTSTQDMEVDEELKKCVWTSPAHLSTTTLENTTSINKNSLKVRGAPYFIRGALTETMVYSPSSL